MQDFKNEEFREPEQLSLFVNLDGFEGPIDLLLTLAKEQKVDLSKMLSCYISISVFHVHQ